MSPRFIRVTSFLVIIFVLLGVTLFLLPQFNSLHRKVNTAGKVIYISDADSAGRPHVWIINRDGTGAKDLTPGGQSCADPAFSPDGSQIAYTTDKAGTAQVYTMDADGENQQPITFGSASKEWPKFSPDGKALTYITQGTLTQYSVDSKDNQQLLPPPAAATSATTAELSAIGHDPVIKYWWAPGPVGDANHEPPLAAIQDVDSENLPKQIADMYGDGELQVMTVLPTGSAQPKIAAYAPSISACWSPDGSQLYAAIIGGKGGQSSTFSGIVSYTAKGDLIPKRPLALVESATEGPVDPSVSPDDASIMFTVLNVPDLAHQRIIGVFVQPVDGSQPPREVISGPVTNMRWSPDGKQILALLPIVNSNNHDIWVTSTTGGAQAVDITKGAGNVTQAEWSPSIAKTN